ncbi:threonine synthase [Caproiciproducens faecalis]|uniref:Threonine synthase n=1 Tax=Caproiciproducens faecalis TaxID=2820301 RepID=A0ABS7DSC9_9FIRM|nr:threonine synthase [Caproiciproducens faecalis]MBW7574026.1 threonine synthase [Caproiciproducens faecalis]
MNYHSTRNSGISVSSAQAISQGISKEGGLFVPEKLPHFLYSDLLELQHCSYTERAVRILSAFLSDFTAEEITECVKSAYTGGKFDQDMPAPISYLQNGKMNMYLLELWHGPTCAFKDMALQLLPHLLTKSLKKIQSSKTALILVATSGDTGKAALEGFKDVDGTRIQVFYPENGVSPMQKRQMNTQEGSNVSVCAIEGNFDDAQTGVKKIFTNPEISRLLEQNGIMFSSANSINWGRLLPQIVYYFSAYCDLMANGEIDYEGEKVNIVVPTGNFGNILAAYYAKKMGLPVKKLICASNANNVLTDFLNTGVYDRNRDFHTTISPSMDILVSSNLERLLYDLTGNNSEKITGWMNELSSSGRYKVDEDILSQIHELFYAGFCDDAATKETIKEIYQTENYLCDTHTAVAVNVYHQYAEAEQDEETPTIIVSTASPYKFADSVLNAVSSEYRADASEFEKVQELSAVTGTPIPTPIAELEAKKVRFDTICSKDKMGEAVLKTAGIKYTV